MKILAMFECAWAGRPGKFQSPVYGISWCNRKNATYARVLPHLERVATLLHLSETTPVISADRKTKPPVDLEHIRSAVAWADWDLIVSFGKRADQALTDIGATHVALPHPVSRQWRRKLIEDLVDGVSHGA